MIGTTFPVEGIEQLAQRVKSEAAKLRTELDALRAACQRDPNFTGAAAARYDEYMQKWDSGQRQLLEALDGAGNILQQLGARLREQDQAFATSFGG